MCVAQERPKLCINERNPFWLFFFPCFFFGHILVPPCWSPILYFWYFVRTYIHFGATLGVMCYSDWQNVSDIKCLTVFIHSFGRNFRCHVCFGWYNFKAIIRVTHPAILVFFTQGYGSVRKLHFIEWMVHWQGAMHLLSWPMVRNRRMWPVHLRALVGRNNLGANGA